MTHQDSFDSALDDGDRGHQGPENTPRLRLGHEIDLLVVPVATGAEDAHDIMMAAAASDNVSPVDLLLAGAHEDPATSA